MRLPPHIFNQLLATFAVCQISIITGIVQGWPIVAIPDMMRGEPMKLTTDQISWVVALVDLGGILSPIPTSYYMDLRGRLAAMRVATLSIILGAVVALVATAPIHLYMARIVTGLGKGIFYTSYPAYIAEMSSPGIRNALAGSVMVFMGIGMAGTMTFTNATLPSYQWVIILLSLLFLILDTFIEETPYFYYMQGNSKAAEKAFYWVRNKSDYDSRRELAAIRINIEESKKEAKSFFDLFRGKGNRRSLIVLGAVISLDKLGGMAATMSYASTSLPAHGTWDPTNTVIILGWVCFIGNCLSSAATDKIGLKPLLLVCSTTLGLIQGTMALFYYLYQKRKKDVLWLTFLPHSGIIVTGFLFSCGLRQASNTLKAEIFPTKLKGHASAMVSVGSALFSFISNKIYLSVNQWVGLYANYFAFCFVNFTSASFIAFYMFETTGLSLVEIQSILNSRVKH